VCDGSRRGCWFGAVATRSRGGDSLGSSSQRRIPAAVRILGPPEVAKGDRLVALGAGTQRAPVAPLLAHVNKAVPSDRRSG
jgi:hypothetical protein